MVLVFQKLDKQIVPGSSSVETISVSTFSTLINVYEYNHHARIDLRIIDTVRQISRNTKYILILSEADFYGHPITFPKR